LAHSEADDYTVPRSLANLISVILTAAHVFLPGDKKKTNVRAQRAGAQQKKSEAGRSEANIIITP
jgi:hypothetical protein